MSVENEYIVRLYGSVDLQYAPDAQVLRVARLAISRLKRAGWLDSSQHQAIIRTTAPGDVVCHMVAGVEVKRPTRRWATKRFYASRAEGSRVPQCISR